MQRIMVLVSEDVPKWMVSSHYQNCKHDRNSNPQASSHPLRAYLPALSYATPALWAAFCAASDTCTALLSFTSLYLSPLNLLSPLPRKFLQPLLLQIIPTIIISNIFCSYRPHRVGRKVPFRLCSMNLTSTMIIKATIDTYEETTPIKNVSALSYHYSGIAIQLEIQTQHNFQFPPISTLWPMLLPSLSPLQLSIHHTETRRLNTVLLLLSRQETESSLTASTRLRLMSLARSPSQVSVLERSNRSTGCSGKGTVNFPALKTCALPLTVHVWF